MNNTSSPLKDAQPSCLGCQHEKEAHLTPCNSCCDEMGWRHNYTPAPRPAPVDEMKCSGQNCMWDRSRLAFDSGHCVGCDDFTPKQPAPAPAPKVTDADTLQKHAHREMCNLRDLCFELGMKVHGKIIEDEMQSFIRTLSQRAGEEYTVGQISDWLDSRLCRQKFTTKELKDATEQTNLTINYAKQMLNDPQSGIKAVTNKKENHV